MNRRCHNTIPLRNTPQFSSSDRLAQDLELLVVDGRRADELVRDVRDQLGLAGAKHLRGPVRRIGIERIALSQRPGPPLACGIAMNDCRPFDAPVRLEELDERPVRDLRHGEARDLLERAATIAQRGSDLFRDT